MIIGAESRGLRCDKSGLVGDNELGAVASVHFHEQAAHVCLGVGQASGDEDQDFTASDDPDAGE
jgi:hypothetical protein